jgi:hypothetical protein
MQLSHLVEEYCTQLRRRCGHGRCAGAGAARLPRGARAATAAAAAAAGRGRRCAARRGGPASPPARLRRRRARRPCGAPGPGCCLQAGPPARGADRTPRPAPPPPTRARRQIEGSFQCAKRTAEIMRLLITTQRHPDAASLIEDVRTVGTKLQAAKPVGACRRAARPPAGGCSEQPRSVPLPQRGAPSAPPSRQRRAQSTPPRPRPRTRPRPPPPPAQSW